MADHEQDIYDLGLNADVAMLMRSPMNRRRILRMGALGIGFLLTGCGVNQSTSSSGATASATSATTSAGTTSAASGADAVACVSEIPEETAGPYPADGSNASRQSLNVLTLSGIVRSDLRTSIGTKNVAAGIPCQFELILVDSNSDCAPLAKTRFVK